MNSIAHPRGSETPLAILVDDWKLLVAALGSTLGLDPDDLFPPVARIAIPEGAPQAHADLLVCTEALTRLHASAMRQLEQQRQLESEMSDVRAALAQARAEEARARHEALHDDLTALPNRNFFRARLEHVVAQAPPPPGSIAVFYLDLDGFKHVNDAHGHEVGDELLKIVATRLSHAVRANDMVGRVGGDEFACLIAGPPSREHLSHLACKLLDAVSAPLQIGAIALAVRPSIGISTWPGDGQTPDALLRSADSAMYRAKRRKCGYTFFDDGADVWVHDAA